MGKKGRDEVILFIVTTGGAAGMEKVCFMLEFDEVEKPLVPVANVHTYLKGMGYRLTGRAETELAIPVAAMIRLKGKEKVSREAEFTLSGQAIMEIWKRPS